MVNMENIVVAGIDFKDYPDFCDAYIESAEKDGIPLTDQELDELDRDFIYECIINQIF